MAGLPFVSLRAEQLSRHVDDIGVSGSTARATAG